MKVRIKRLPALEMGGGLFNTYPWASKENTNPFGNISTNTDDLDKNINDTIKPIETNKANIEAEKGEILFKFDAGGIFKIQGKKHSDGGTPLKAETGDFIFSDNTNLVITKDDAENFELKGVTKGKKANTPARVLAKNIDIKKYNKLISTLNNTNSDDIAKTTAQLMLSKYLEKIGQIGFLQENKKDFPTGMPEFSEGTAPVYSKDVKDAKEQTEQFRYGGKFFSGGTTDEEVGTAVSYDKNGMPIDEHKGDKTNGSLTPTGLKNSFNFPGGISGYIDAWATKAGINFDPKEKNNVVQSKVYDYLLANNPDIVRNMWKTYGNTNRGRDLKIGKGWDFNNLTNDQLTKLKPAYTDNKFGVRQMTPDMIPTNLGTPTPPATQLPPVTVTTKRPPAAEVPNPGTITNYPTKGFHGFDIGMNGLEGLTVAMPGLTALAQKTFYDPLIQKYSPEVRLDRLSNQAEINDIQQQGSLSKRESFANAPFNIAALAAGQVDAAETGNIMRSNGNINNANTQIANQEVMTNYQTKQQDNLFNLGQIQQTTRNNMLSEQRRQEQLTNGFVGSVNNAVAVQGNLDKINMNLNTAALPYLTNAYYDKENNLIGQGDEIKTMSQDQRDKIAYAKQVSPIGVNPNTRMPYSTGFGSLNSVQAQGDPSEIMKSYIDAAIKKGVTPDRALEEFNKQYTPNAKNTSPFEEMLQALMRRLPPTN